MTRFEALLSSNWVHPPRQPARGLTRNSPVLVAGDAFRDATLRARERRAELRGRPDESWAWVMAVVRKVLPAPLQVRCRGGDGTIPDVNYARGMGESEQALVWVSGPSGADSKLERG